MAFDSKSQTDPVILPSGMNDDAMVSGLEGSYRVIRLLGRGTMASVYLAEQVSMARPVALKILSQVLASDPEFVERFLREARASARLNHPNIVSAIDFGEFQNRFFLAMEFVDGMALSSLLISDGALEEKRVVSIGLQVISALSHANEHNVIHLDVKPANIMICKDGRVKLADFGLAMILDSPGSAEASRKAVGTPYYMAPEQVEGGKLDWRTDQFSLGASLYEAVTGLKPFTGNSVSDILVKRFFERPEPAWKTGRKVSRSFSAVLAKMMSRSPDGRYQSFVDLETDFHRVRDGVPPLVAKLDSVSSSAPSGLRREQHDYESVIGRIDGMLWRKRRTWATYSALLFLGALVVYTGLHARELVGPVPPRLVRSNVLAEAEHPPEDLATPTREIWNGAIRLMGKAEKEPALETIRKAIYTFRLLSTSRELFGTAYATAAKRRLVLLDEELAKLEAEYPDDANSLEEMLP